MEFELKAHYTPKVVCLVTGRPIIRNIYHFRCPLRLTPFLGLYVALVPPTLTMFIPSLYLIMIIMISQELTHRS